MIPKLRKSGSDAFVTMVVVGPVIGEVTSSTARILAEIDRDGDLLCFVREETNEGEGKLFEVTKKLKKGVPGVLVFEGLSPSTPYIVSFPHTRNCDEREGYFKTMGKTMKNMTIVSLSCNSMNEPEEPIVWNDLIERYIAPRRVDLLIHLGDQVYADEAYEQGMEIIKSVPHANTRPEIREKIVDCYRAFYRKTWNNPPTRYVLANVPNLMMWDDHDVRNDWGSHPTDSDPFTPEYFVGLCARQAYWEYQRQLWDDVFTKDENSIKMDAHFHLYDQIGVAFVDNRGCRSFYYSPHDEGQLYLSKPQWDALRTSVSNSGLYANCKCLIVVMSTALCCIGPSMSKIGGKAMKDKMGFGLHPVEQLNMIKLLEKWKSDKSDRDVLLLGGDLHMGVRTEISKNDKLLFEQFITSPIRHHSPPGIGFNLMKGAMLSQESLAEGYSFKHTSIEPTRNFGIFNIEMPAEGSGGHGIMRGTIYFHSEKKSTAESHSGFFNSGDLIISKVSGRSLADKDDNGLSDPYFKLNFLDLKIKSSVLKKTLNPDFPEVFKMAITNLDYVHGKSSEDNPPIMEIELFDYDRGGLHDPMGKVEVNLLSLLKNKGDFSTREQKFEALTVVPQKKERVAGTLSFTLTFKPTA